MGTQRLGRIADQIQRELAELVRLELRDPRVRMVTLTDVELSRDQSHAKVFFTTLGPADDVAACLEGLQRAAGFLRTSLAKRLTVRKVPELHFAHDESIERGARLSQLIDEALRTPPVVVKAKPTPKAKPKSAPKAKPKPAPKPKRKPRVSGA